MTVENSPKELGPIVYRGLKTVYGGVGFGYGAVLGVLGGIGLALTGTLIGEGIAHILSTPISAGQDFHSVFFDIAIPASAFFGLISGSISGSLGLEEFNRDFKKRKATRRTK